MTNFMKILCGLTCVGDPRASVAPFQSTCKLCQESHKTQVWLCFLVLSLLSTSCVAETEHLNECVKKMRHIIEKSDALLYAPSIGYNQDRCESVSLNCYLCELKMVLLEEGRPESDSDCVSHYMLKHFEEAFPEPSQNVGCLPCEAHSLKNISVFMDNLSNLLEKLTVRGTLQKVKAEG